MENASLNPDINTSFATSSFKQNETQGFSKKLVIFLVALEVFTLIIAGFLAYQVIKLGNEIKSSKMEATPSPSPEALTFLNKYVNSSYSFEFNYPQEYSVKNNTGEGYDDNVGTATSLTVFDANNNIKILLDISEKQDRDFENYIQQSFDTASSSTILESDKEGQEMVLEDNTATEPPTDEVINSLNAKTYKIQGNTLALPYTVFAMPTESSLETKYVVFESDNYFYHVAILGEDEMTQTVLNSFTLNY